MSRLASLLVCALLVQAVAAAPASRKTNQVAVDYVRPDSPVLVPIFETLKERRFLEELARDVTGRFVLPGQLKITLATCESPGAFYVAEEKNLVNCLELLPFLSAAIQRDRRLRRDPETAQAVLDGALSFIAFHELGHALVDLFDLPLLGREEDAADQIAAYLILTGPDASSRQHAVEGALLFFRSTRGRFTLEELAGEHGLAQQRQVNVACWAYGSDPEVFGWAPEAGRLTPERAAQCAREYKKLDSTMRRVFGNALRAVVPTRR